MASDKDVPLARIEAASVSMEGKPVHPKAMVWLSNWMALCHSGQAVAGSPSTFANALSSSTEDDVRAAIKAVRVGREEVEKALDVCRNWKDAYPDASEYMQ